MKVLLTGAFGNVGLSTLEELLKRNYDIRIFDIKTKKNKKLGSKYRKYVEILWGDLRNYKDIERATSDRDVVIHVAAIIPPLADKKPKFAESINVGGTANIIKALEKQSKSIDKVVYKAASEGELLKRLGGRRICRNCQTPYHEVDSPPKKPGVCDRCSGYLYQRDDDNVATIKKRLEVYFAETSPLIDYYNRTGKLLEINGEGNAAEVNGRIAGALI